MGVIIKYRLEFPEAGVGVSNDLYGGEFLLDADIKVSMERGRAGTSFQIHVYDLPLVKARELDKLLQGAGALSVIASLGYFDGEFAQVLDGRVRKIQSTVSADGERLITTFEGVETGAYVLSVTELQESLPLDRPVGEIVQYALEKVARPGLDRKASIENVNVKLRDKALRGNSLLDVLDELATQAEADLLVRDRKVWLGRPVKDDGYKPASFDTATNLASFEPFAADVPAGTDRNLLKPLAPMRVEGFNFVITGDPALRPAQAVSASVEGFDGLSGAEFRIRDLTHDFGIGGGYVCRGTAVRTRAGDDSVSRAGAAGALGHASAATFVDTLTKKIQDGRRQRPVVEVAQVKSYAPGGGSGAERHLSTLYFGQRFPREETQPSLRAAVETGEGQLFRNKPLASPFAWHRCGLVVPVYPGMKAMLSHNLGMPDDAVVSGFMWSEQPGIEPPKNKEGDWWVCLPIDFDTARPPAPNTLAANDLTANNGRRVVQVKGLRVTVGANLLGTVGERPEEGADDEFLIEHQEGAKIVIDSEGVVTIHANKGLKIAGDVSVEGNVKVSGDLELKDGNVNARGNVAVNGNLDVKDGNVTINGNVDIL
ncbi:MAG: hypothetical protein QOJ76_56 [Acidobacteriota bacterium]|jgi:hypothetical protein|nr:hypothetical protein [Acidobacteriota bacterium]